MKRIWDLCFWFNFGMWCAALFMLGLGVPTQGAVLAFGLAAPCYYIAWKLA